MYIYVIWPRTPIYFLAGSISSILALPMLVTGDDVLECNADTKSSLFLGIWQVVGTVTKNDYQSWANRQ